MSESVWTSEFQGAFEHCRYLLGDELLAFLVNAPEALASDPRAGRTVRKLAASFDLLEREDPRIPVALVRTRQADGLPVAWGIRRANGGAVPAPRGSNELELVLTRIARDVYPVLLGPSDEMIVAGPGLTLPAADATISLDQLVESHPERQRAAELVAASALAAERLSDAATPSAIIATAARRLRHVERPDAAPFMELVIEVLDQLRVLAEGNQIQVPAFVGFTALPLLPESHLTLPQGVLRASTKSERRFVPFALQAEAVLSTTVAYQIFAPGEDAALPHADGQMALNQRAREVILAAALSSNEGVPRSSPSVAWVVSQGFGHGSSSYRPLYPERPPGRTEPMTGDEMEAIKRWAGHVTRADLAHVEIAIDRTLRAIWETDWTDSLIDAVIAWENLVGTRSETAYRVTAALAVLCQDDPEKRIATRKDLGSAYNARSRLVHGDRAPADLHQHRELAIQTALEALRRLITERQDLLALSNSSKRADRLLLGVEVNQRE
ncbi:MAG TPA: hypothetical protein VK781_04395 [Solirubrobacteraceae bacterium]|jgi:hypothetical protein|nr:hypothetical protein [Solirubrobacteraceae bacterium]